MKNDKPNWNNASWEGSRIAQLKRSLKLTPKQRFDALENFSETSDWLAKSNKNFYFQPVNNTPNYD